MPGDNDDTPFEILIREEREEFLKDIENLDMNSEDVAPCGDGIYPACPSQIGKTYHMDRTRAPTVIPTSGDAEQISQYRSYALNGRDGKPPTHELSSTNRKLFTYIGEK